MKTFYTSQETDVIMLMSVFINTHLIIPLRFKYYFKKQTSKMPGGSSEYL